MLHPPAGAHFEIIKMNKKQFLTGVLGRLRNDVGTYLDFVTQRNSEMAEGVGFWGSIRLLMPVIETVANAYKQTPESLLGNELGVATPSLAWILYRHSLAHNDLLQHGQYDGVSASWGVSMLGMNHIMRSGIVSIDTLKLYGDFVAFLEREIAATNGVDEVEIIQGVVWDNPGQSIKDEFAELA